MRVLGVVAAVVLVAGLGWLLFGGGGEARDPGPLVEDEGREDGTGPTLRSAPGGTEPGGDAPPKGSDTPGADDADAAPPHHVVGRIEGLDATELARTTVRVHGLANYDWVDGGVKAVEGAPARDGGFAIDIGPLRARHPGTGRIRVDVDHPAHVVAKVKLDLAPANEPRTEVPGPITLDDALIVDVQVETAQGSPAKGALVALYGMEGDELMLTEQYDALAYDHGIADDDGRLRLRTTTSGPAFLAAWAPKHAPTGERLVISAREPMAPRTLRLEAGHPITGRVLLNGQPLPGASVRAYPKIDGSETSLSRVKATWSAGRLYADGVMAKTDAKGAFAFHGQDRSTRNLRVVAVEGYFMRNRSIGWSEREVTPPALDIDVELEAAIIDLQVVAGAEPLKDVRIGIAAPNANWRSTRTSPTGEVTMLLPVDKPMVIFAEHKRHEKAERTLEGLAAGSRVREVLDMGPAKAASSLRITLKDPAGKPVTSAGFIVTKDITPGFGFESGLGLKKSDTGEYLLEDLEPGACVLVVFPGRAPDAYRGDWLVHQESLELIAGREKTMALTARRGGTLVVTVKDHEGAVTSAYATLKDAQGEEVEVSWFWSNESSASMTTSGPGGADAQAIPPLAPGEYELELSADGHVSRTERFRVTEGETTRLEVVLAKE